jgi:hypothetical protein
MLDEKLNLQSQTTSKKNKVRIIQKEPSVWEASFFCRTGIPFRKNCKIYFLFQF